VGDSFLEPQAAGRPEAARRRAAPVTTTRARHGGVPDARQPLEQRAVARQPFLLRQALQHGGHERVDDVSPSSSVAEERPDDGIGIRLVQRSTSEPPRPRVRRQLGEAIE